MAMMKSSELRKLVRMFNKRTKLTIPKGLKGQSEMINFLEKHGTIDHKAKVFLPSTKDMGTQLKLSDYDKMFPPKTAEQKAEAKTKSSQKKASSEDNMVKTLEGKGYKITKPTKSAPAPAPAPAKKAPAPAKKAPSGDTTKAEKGATELIISISNELLKVKNISVEKVMKGVKNGVNKFLKGMKLSPAEITKIEQGLGQKYTAREKFITNQLSKAPKETTGISSQSKMTEKELKDKFEDLRAQSLKILVDVDLKDRIKELAEKKKFKKGLGGKMSKEYMDQVEDQIIRAEQEVKFVRKVIAEKRKADKQVKKGKEDDDIKAKQSKFKPSKPTKLEIAMKKKEKELSKAPAKKAPAPKKEEPLTQDNMKEIIDNWGTDTNNILIEQNHKKLKNGIVSLWDSDKKFINIDGLFQFDKPLFNKLFMKYPAQKVIDGLENFMLYITDSDDTDRIGQKDFSKWFEIRDGRTQSQIRGKDINQSSLNKLIKEWDETYNKKEVKIKSKK